MASAELARGLKLGLSFDTGAGTMSLVMWRTVTTEPSAQEAATVRAHLIGALAELGIPADVSQFSKPEWRENGKGIGYPIREILARVRQLSLI